MYNQKAMDYESGICAGRGYGLYLPHVGANTTLTARVSGASLDAKASVDEGTTVNISVSSSTSGHVGKVYFFGSGEEIVGADADGGVNIVMPVGMNLRLVSKSVPGEYSLTITKGDHTTLSVTKNGVEMHSGDIVHGGDVLTVTATADTGYTLTLKNGNSTISSGATVTVASNTTITSSAALTKYKLAVTATNATVTVKKGSSTVSPGNTALTHGDEITVEAAASEGYTLSTLTYNGTAIESSATTKYTVTGNVAIVATGEASE